MEFKQEISKEVSIDTSKYSGKFTFFQCDIMKESDIEITFQKLCAERGPVWILVNNAGGGVDGLLHGKPCSVLLNYV